MWSRVVYGDVERPGLLTVHSFSHLQERRVDCRQRKILEVAENRQEKFSFVAAIKTKTPGAEGRLPPAKNFGGRRKPSRKNFFCGGKTNF
jgi:hypothetical protein